MNLKNDYLERIYYMINSNTIEDINSLTVENAKLKRHISDLRLVLQYVNILHRNRSGELKNRIEKVFKETDDY